MFLDENLEKCERVRFGIKPLENAYFGYDEFPELARILVFIDTDLHYAQEMCLYFHPKNKDCITIVHAIMCIHSYQENGWDLLRGAISLMDCDIHEKIRLLKLIKKITNKYISDQILSINSAMDTSEYGEIQ